MTSKLNVQKALIFRITHIRNVPWILQNGLHCKNSGTQDPNFVSIGSSELIQRRSSRGVPVPPEGTLSDYIPFYFTPFSMMMYNIHTGYGGVRQVPNSEIVIFVSSLRKLAKRGVVAVFSDRHAYLKTAQFFTSLEDLDEIDWDIYVAVAFMLRWLRRVRVNRDIAGISATFHFGRRPYPMTGFSAATGAADRELRLPALSLRPARGWARAGISKVPELPWNAP